MKQFKDVNMYVNMTNSSIKNYEHLFAINGTKGDPPANSIFNLTTLQLLLNLSQSIHDIIEFPGSVF